MKIKQIYVDMDGVLFDFFGSALKLYEKKNIDFNKKDFLKSYPCGRDDLSNILGITWTEFWDMVDSKGKDFWYGLQKLPDSDYLIRYCKTMASVSILTKGNRNPLCYAGKKESLDKHFPALPVWVTSTDKSDLSTEGRILIDDKYSNIHKWCEAGGTGILYPQLWNKNYEFSDKPVEYVTGEIAKIAQFYN